MVNQISGVFVPPPENSKKQNLTTSPQKLQKLTFLCKNVELHTKISKCSLFCEKKNKSSLIRKKNEEFKKVCIFAHFFVCKQKNEQIAHFFELLIFFYETVKIY